MTIHKDHKPSFWEVVYLKKKKDLSIFAPPKHKLQPTGNVGQDSTIWSLKEYKSAIYRGGGQTKTEVPETRPLYLPLIHLKGKAGQSSAETTKDKYKNTSETH